VCGLPLQAAEGVEHVYDLSTHSIKSGSGKIHAKEKKAGLGTSEYE